MQLDVHEVWREGCGEGARIAVCEKLPYYITSPLLMRLLECRRPIEKLVVMVQKEAAERLCAEVGSREAGAVTVAVRYYAEAHTRFTVGREGFLPAPKVDSAAIALSVRKSPAVELRDEAYSF